MLLLSFSRCCAHSATSSSPGRLAAHRRASGINMQDSVVRNIEAPTPSLREQAEDRRQRVKFSGWCLICLLGLLGVYREMYSTLGDVLGSVAEMSASPRGVGGVSMAERFGKDMGSLIASTKVGAGSDRYHADQTACL